MTFQVGLAVISTPTFYCIALHFFTSQVWNHTWVEIQDHCIAGKNSITHCGLEYYFYNKIVFIF